LSPPILRPAELVPLQSPFDDERFVFELKHDGFRALAYLTPDGCRLVSRRGNVYKSFRSLCDSLLTLECAAVLDGEIVTLDENGRPKFYDLLRRRGAPLFYAFDCLWHDGKDLRSVPLLQRKQTLERIVGNHPSVLLAQHVESLGCQLFKRVCEQDLEGVVAKRKDAAYGVDWFKIRNPTYSQYEGRQELFERRIARTRIARPFGPQLP
jgi:bifunctional non-homologous end joining protein LigD